MSVLAIKDLSVAFKQKGAVNKVVDHATLTIEKGEIVALVGESGSGKSVTALSVLKLLPYPHAYHPSGHIMYGEADLLPLSERSMREIRGNRISMVFQEPMTSLNPLHTIEKQINEVLLVHKKMRVTKARERCIELLEMVGLPHFKDRLNAYPHELSGGQRQRVMIAMALANEPEMLIADEPTTALDVTVQKKILELIKSLQREIKMSVLLITHDLTIVKRIADRVCVMQQGKIVEDQKTADLFANPKHSYTKVLLASEPKGDPVKLPEKPREILSAKGICVDFTLKKDLFGRPTKILHAVKNVGISLQGGETLGIVGESGSGKTTLAMAVLRLVRSRGEIIFDDQRIDQMQGKELRPIRAAMQIVFQDPFASLNPRMTVGQVIGEGLQAHNIGAHAAERDAMICDVLKEVELNPAMRHRYPHEFSGGQRQRIAIARAVVLNPKLIVLDEPTSALDLTVQTQILALLKKLQQERQISYLFISHDLRTIKTISHHIMVMKDGEVVEYGKNKDIFARPSTNYTHDLIDAAFPKVA